MAALTGCSKENKVDIDQGTACTTDSDCPDDGEPCTIEKCKADVCSWDDAADGASCPEGQCRSARCCTGCWDSSRETCEKGLTDSARCGVGGGECRHCTSDGACSSGATCEAGQCVQKRVADGSPCTVDEGHPGACHEGACCGTCVVASCNSPGCTPGCQSEAQLGPIACGAGGIECKTCEELDGNPCTWAACVAGMCQQVPVDGFQPGCMKCENGVCVIGMEGQPCGTLSPRCSEWLECIAETCVKCGQPGERCCTDPDAPATCAGGGLCEKNVCCNVSESAMQTDVDNCGACLHKCSEQLKNATSFTCSAGQCVLKECKPDHFDLDANSANGCEACTTPLAICPGPKCVDPKKDNDNCGGCGVKCTAPASCSNSSCECAAPMLVCGVACTDPRSDPWNCGGCNSACPDASMCIGSTCRPGAVVVVDSEEGVEGDAGTPAEIGSFVVDQTNIYFTRGTALYKRPLAGGASVKLVETPPPSVFEHLQARAGRVFFALGNVSGANAPVLSSVLPDGSSRVDYAFQLGQGIANYVVDDNYVYWIPRSHLQGMEIKRRPIAGGMDAGPYATTARDFGLCQDLILYADLAGPMHTRRIGEPSPVDLDPKLASRLIVGATSDAIVFVNHDGAVYRVPVATRQPELIAPANVFPPNATAFTHHNAGLIDAGTLVYPVEIVFGAQTTMALFSLEIASGTISPRARFPQALPAATSPRFGSFGGKVYFWGGSPVKRIYREP